MKKLLSAVLMITMLCFPVCRVYAADTVGGRGDTGSEAGIDTLWGPFTLSSKTIVTQKNDTFAYGDTVYYLLLDGEGDPIVDEDAVKNVSVKTEWDDGGEYIGGTKITRLTAADGDGTDFFGGSRASCWLLEISVSESALKSERDVSGTVRLKCTKDSFEVEADYSVDFVLGYGEPKDYSIICEDPFLYDGDTLQSFADDEWEFEFEAAEDMTLTVDVTRQSDILLWMTTDENDVISDRYRTASLDFYTGSGVNFRETGEYFIPAGEESFLYQVVGDSLCEIPSARYDEYDKGWYFNDKTLGSYVVSDMELDTDASQDSSEFYSSEDGSSQTQSTVFTDDPQNPATGAAL